MSLISFNSQVLSQQTGHEVPEIYVVIAKHEVLGFEEKQIAETIGATLEEIAEVKQDRIYQDILLIMRADHASSHLESDLSWDAIEEVALGRLFKRVQNESDGDFLLKVAAVANRAQRRTTRGDPVLDPSQQGIRVPLTLTRRSVERYNANGGREIERTEQVRIADMRTPSFAEVDSLLHVQEKPALPQRVEIRTLDATPSFDSLMADMDAEMRGGA